MVLYRLIILLALRRENPFGMTLTWQWVSLQTFKPTSKRFCGHVSTSTIWCSTHMIVTLITRKENVRTQYM